MNNKALIRLVVILLLNSFAIFLIRTIMPEIFDNSSIGKQKITACFALIFVFLNIVFSIFENRKFVIASTRAFLWLGIFMLVITAYAFKSELTYAKQRVLAVLIPYYQWTGDKGELMIARSGDGHFYINAIINGVAIKFMIDTGASDVALTPKDAQKLNFDAKNLNYNRSYATANGIAKGASVNLKEVIVGGARLIDIEGHVGNVNLDISLLGMSVLEKFKSFRIESDILILSY